MIMLSKKNFITCSAICLFLLGITYNVCYAEEKEDINPIGCVNEGYTFKLKTVFLSKEKHTQAMYFFYNLRDEPVSLYQMLKADSSRSLYINHTIEPHQWAVLSISEPRMRFICTIPNKQDDYGDVVDCATSIKVCQDVNVKFGLNNKGNFWLVGSNTKNGALRQVVNYGIIP